MAGSVGLQTPLHTKVCRGCALSETSTGRLRPSTCSRWSSVRSPPDFDLFSTRPLTFAGAYDCLTVLCVCARWLWCAWVRHFLQVLPARWVTYVQCFRPRSSILSATQTSGSVVGSTPSMLSQGLRVPFLDHLGIPPKRSQSGGLGFLAAHRLLSEPHEPRS